jgi:hypothetical protein
VIDFRTKFPDADKGYTTDAWWESEEFQKARQKTADRDEAKATLLKDAKTLEIEKIAKEWGKREYFRQAMAGTIDNDAMTEEDYIKSIWDRAMFEGELKYRQLRGETDIDTAAELQLFQKQQEKKQAAMLERAKAELTSMLESEGLGGEDLQRKLNPPPPDKSDEEYSLTGYKNKK